MPDHPATPTPAVAPTPNLEEAHEQPPGYFDKAQLADITTAKELLAVAEQNDYKAKVVAKGFGDEQLTLLRTAISEARTKTTQTGQAGDKKKTANLNGKGTQRALIEKLHGIQSAAKQKKKLLDADDDPTTNFSLEGCLIGTRLNPSKSVLLQNADALLAKATTDALPEFNAARLSVVATAIKTYRDSKDDQAEATEDNGEERLARVKLIKKISAYRVALQYAADRAFRYTNEDNAPNRTVFELPVDRVFNV